MFLLMLQLFASLIVTEYVPFVKLEIVSLVELLFHKKVYPGVPPETVTQALPLLMPQVSGNELIVELIAVGLLIVTFIESLQFALSLTTNL